MDPSSVMFVLEELAKFAGNYSGRAVEVAKRFTEDFASNHPELIKPGDDESPSPRTDASIDNEVDVLIDQAKL